MSTIRRNRRKERSESVYSGQHLPNVTAETALSVDSRLIRETLRRYMASMETRVAALEARVKSTSGALVESEVDMSNEIKQ